MRRDTLADACSNSDRYPDAGPLADTDSDSHSRADSNANANTDAAGANPRSRSYSRVAVQPVLFAGTTGYGPVVLLDRWRGRTDGLLVMRYVGWVLLAVIAVVLVWIGGMQYADRDNWTCAYAGGEWDMSVFERESDSKRIFVKPESLLGTRRLPCRLSLPTHDECDIAKHGPTWELSR